MRRITYFGMLLSLSALFVLLTGCNPLAPTPATSSTSAVVNTSPAGSTEGSQAQGTATVSGTLVNRGTNAKLSGTILYLAQIYYGQNPSDGGFYALDPDRSPRTQTKDDGTFSFQGVAGADYVVIVGEGPADKQDVVADGAGQPQVFKVADGQTLDIGTVQTNFTQ